MTRIEYIYNLVKSKEIVTNNSPILFVGGAVYVFKSIYKGHIYRLENTDDVKEFIRDFYNVEYDKPIVVEDLSLLYRDSIMLKLIEEIKLPLILLATEDNLSVPLQSRIKTYVKFPLDMDLGCTYTPVLDAFDYITQNELSGKQLDKYMAENCPDLAILYDQIKTKKHKDKLVQLLGGIKDGKLKTR